MTTESRMATTRLEGTPYYDGNQWYIVKEGAKTPKHKGQTIDRANPPADSRLVVEGIHIERDNGAEARGEWRVLMPTRMMENVVGRLEARTAAARTVKAAARTAKAPRPASRSTSRSASRSPVMRRLPRLPAYEGYSKAAENAAFKEFRTLAKFARRRPGQTVRVSPASRSRSRSRSPLRRAATVRRARRVSTSPEVRSNIEALEAQLDMHREMCREKESRIREKITTERARLMQSRGSMSSSASMRSPLLPAALAASGMGAASAAPVFQLGPPRRVSNSGSNSNSNSSNSGSNSSTSVGSFLE
jgi:hypothetical protein